MPEYYIHAFTLDEGKAKEGHEEMIVGPFEWVGITWDFFRAGRHDDSVEDLQFIRHDSGYWYPVVLITYGMGGSLQADPTRGRFSDLYIMTEDQVEKAGITQFSTAHRKAEPDEDLGPAWADEYKWQEEYQG